MNRRLLLGMLFVAGLTLISSPAAATQNNPHHEEADGCDHGHTGKPCKPDPQPDHGKDCEHHGNHGGINEDHCQSTTTTIVPPTTTTTAPPSEPTTTTTTTTDSPSQNLTTTTTTIPTITIPSLGCMDSDGFPFVTNVEQGGCPGGPTQTPALSTVEATTELPKTGVDAGLLFVISTCLILGGLSCWFCGKAIE